MKCKRCGLCREKCPLFLALLKESVSPRGKGILKNEEIKDKVLYLCTLCGACDCKIHDEDEIISVREDMVNAGITLKRNKQFIENLKKHGHPFFEPKKKK